MKYAYIIQNLAGKTSKYAKQLYEAVKFYEDFEDGKGDAGAFIERFNKGFDFSIPVPSDFGARNGTEGTKAFLDTLSKGFLKFRFTFHPVNSERYRNKSSANVFHVLHDEGGDVISAPGSSDASMFSGYPDWSATEADFATMRKAPNTTDFNGVAFFRDFHQSLSILHNQYLLKQNEALKRMALDVGNDAHIKPELYYPFWGVKQGREMSKNEFATFANRYNKNIDAISNIIKTLTSGRNISQNEADGLYRQLDAIPIITESEIEGKVHGSVFIGVGRRMNNARVMRLHAKNELIKIMNLDKTNLEPIVMSNVKRIEALERELPNILKRKDDFDRFTITNMSEMDAFRRDLQEMDAQNIQNNLKINEELNKIKAEGGGRKVKELSKKLQDVSSLQKMQESDLSKLRGLDEKVNTIDQLRAELEAVKNGNDPLNRTQVDYDRTLRQLNSDLFSLSKDVKAISSQQKELKSFLGMFRELGDTYGNYDDAVKLNSYAESFVEQGGVTGFKKSISDLREEFEKKYSNLTPDKKSKKEEALLRNIRKQEEYFEKTYKPLLKVLPISKEEQQKPLLELSPEKEKMLIKGIENGEYYVNPVFIMNREVYKKGFSLAEETGAVVEVSKVVEVGGVLPKGYENAPKYAFVETSRLSPETVKNLIKAEALPAEYFKDGIFQLKRTEAPSWFRDYRREFNNELSRIQENNKGIDKDFIDSFSVYKEEKKKEIEELRGKVNEVEEKNRDALANLALALQEGKGTRTLFDMHRNTSAQRSTGITERRREAKPYDAAKRFLNNYFSQMFKIYAY